MLSTYSLIEKQLKHLISVEIDLELIKSEIKDDRIYLETEAEIHDENGNYEESEKYYKELDLLLYPVRKLESEIRQIKASIIEDYAELILITTSDVSLANNIIQTKKNYVQCEKIIRKLLEKFGLYPKLH